MEVPSYSYGFSLQTNNLPFPGQDQELRNRYLRWRNRPRGYHRIPQNEHVETSFNESVPEERVQVEPFDEVIDIPEAASETTSLLGGSTVAGEAALLGGSGSVLGTGGTLATGVLGSTLAVGAGVAAKKLYDRISDKGAVLPNSEFIGPGNPIYIGAAKNPSEQAAKEHDINYTNLIEFAKQHEVSASEFSERVHQFDRTAIDQFEKDWKETGNWHAFAGKYGLKTKLIIEKALGGALYPRNPGKVFYI